MSGKSSKRMDDSALEAMQSELSGSAFFQSGQVDKTTSSQTGKNTKPQVDKYTTHLRAETIKLVKRWAFEHDMKDYELVQQALDEFFERQKDKTP